MSSIDYHEPVEELPAETRDMHRAIVSLMEELEAVDWYNQRCTASDDASLKAILEHNRDEEGFIAPQDVQLFTRVDVAEEILAVLEAFYSGNQPDSQEGLPR